MVTGVLGEGLSGLIGEASGVVANKLLYFRGHAGPEISSY